ncbi:hypothetical protein HY212_00705 [Candidatus Pacearchaeota archaeon]|nr:hypothetical protein [Candidatus Pacearchaeota archaeon]
MVLDIGYSSIGDEGFTEMPRGFYPPLIDKVKAARPDLANTQSPRRYHLMDNVCLRYQDGQIKGLLTAINSDEGEVKVGNERYNIDGFNERIKIVDRRDNNGRAYLEVKK